ncbi:hypothetical protein [Dongia rigui]|uniref:NADH dehydrogenase subunit 6 n=1 Tax=Dongia rigui TaxID=940149 RepID=A0ABU5DXX8_9PROT|nr:hypothetical protein [Dongia rigui]MDY0872177.1 hypothetical protein [Dongia rigui]
MNAFRLAALTLIASGTLLLVLDVIENLLSSSWSGMATGYLWSMIWPAGLRGLRSFIETNISVFLWQRVLMPILMLPLWALMLIGGGALLFSGRKDDTQP